MTVRRALTTANACHQHVAGALLSVSDNGRHVVTVEPRGMAAVQTRRVSCQFCPAERAWWVRKGTGGDV